MESELMKGWGLRKIINNIVPGLLFFGLIIYIGIIIYAIDKGFQFSDAGFYVMRYQAYQPLGGDIANEHLLMRTIFSFVHKDIISLRLFEIIISLLSSSFLSFAFYCFYKARYKVTRNGLVLIAVTVFSSVLFHLSTGLCVSYNSLNLYAMIFALGFFLLAVATESIIYSVMVGIFLAFIFYIKISSFCFVVPLFLLFTLIVHIKGQRVWHTLAVFIALILALYISSFNSTLLHGIVEYGNIVKAMLLGGENQTIPSSHSSYCLIRNLIVYGNELLIHAMRGLFIYIFIIIIKQLKPVILKVIFSLFLMCIIGFWMKSNLGLRITNVAPFITGFVIVLLNSIFIVSDGKIYLSDAVTGFAKDNKQLLWIILLLLLLPTINSIGTNGELLDHTKRAIVFYMLGMVSLYICIDSRFTLRVIYFLTAFTILFSSLGMIYHPRCRHYLFEHKYEFQGIKYDKESYGFLCDMEKALKKSGFNTDYGMACLYLSPGLVYLMGSYYPSGVFFSGDAAARFFKYLEETKMSSLPLPAIIVNNTFASDALKSQFLSVGIKFDACYKCIYSHEFVTSPKYKYSLYVPR